MRHYYVIGGGLYTEADLVEFGLESEEKEAIYGCTNGNIPEDGALIIIGNYHFGIDDYKPNWLVKVY